MKVTYRLYECQSSNSGGTDGRDPCRPRRRGRELFGELGFAAVGTQAIVERAGVTRGALYHQFDGKRGLFAAVYDDVERDVTADIASAVGELAMRGPGCRAAPGAQRFLQLITAPEIHRITLVDAPAVLGWAQWRARGEEFGFALVEGLLQAAISVGQIADQPTRPMAHVAIGASTRPPSMSQPPTTGRRRPPR